MTGFPPLKGKCIKYKDLFFSIAFVIEFHSRLASCAHVYETKPIQGKNLVRTVITAKLAFPTHTPPPLSSLHFE